MSAMIEFTEGDPWFDNSLNWATVLDRMLAAVDPADRAGYDWFLNEGGLHFPSVEPARRAAVARLLLTVAEGLRAETAPGAEREDAGGNAHYADLVSKAEHEIEVSAANGR